MQIFFLHYNPSFFGHQIKTLELVSRGSLSQSRNGRGRFGLRRIFALAKRHGFAAVEFGIEWLEQKIASEDEDAARQWLAEQGIQHAAFWLPISWRDEESKYRESLKNLPKKRKLPK